MEFVIKIVISPHQLFAPAVAKLLDRVLSLVDERMENGHDFVLIERFHLVDFLVFDRCFHHA